MWFSVKRSIVWSAMYIQREKSPHKALVCNKIFTFDMNTWATTVRHCTVSPGDLCAWNLSTSFSSNWNTESIEIDKEMMIKMNHCLYRNNITGLLVALKDRVNLIMSSQSCTIFNDPRRGNRTRTSLTNRNETMERKIYNEGNHVVSFHFANYSILLQKDMV